MTFRSRMTVALFATFAAACSSGAGAGGVGYSGAPSGNPCNPEYSGMACATLPTGGTARVMCDTGTSQWTEVEVCGANFYCVEGAPGADGKISSTECKEQAQPQTDTSGGGGGSDGASGGGGGGGGTVDYKEVMACVETSCAAEVGACDALPACKAVLDCVRACETEDCADGCTAEWENTEPPADVLALFLPLGACVEASGCDPEPVSECGDGECSDDENAESCPADCGGGGGDQPVCGNGTCEAGENQANCPADCGGGGGGGEPVCGNGTCEAGENQANCPADCGGGGPVCGDGKCEGVESDTCPQDCMSGPVCGDGSCDIGETSMTCPQDCSVEPECTSSAQCMSGQQCVDGQCVGGGGGTAVCGNGTCEAGESPSTCPADCGGGGGGDSSCVGICEGQAPSGCYCDDACEDPANDDCCPDKIDVCGAAGGGGGGGGGEDCILQQCGAQVQACQADPGCVAAAQCIDGCAQGNDACVQGCFAAASPAAQQALNAFIQCVNTNCAP